MARSHPYRLLGGVGRGIKRDVEILPLGMLWKLAPFPLDAMSKMMKPRIDDAGPDSPAQNPWQLITGFITPTPVLGHSEEPDRM